MVAICCNVNILLFVAVQLVPYHTIVIAYGIRSSLINSYVVVCTSLTLFNNYIMIDGVTICASHLWPTQDEYYKGALRAYALQFESNTEL